MFMIVTITNKNLYGVCDLVIECEHEATSGPLIEKNTRTLYDQGPAGTSLKFD